MIAVPEKRAVAGKKKVRKKRAGTGRILLSPKERRLAAKIRLVKRLGDCGSVMLWIRGRPWPVEYGGGDSRWVRDTAETGEGDGLTENF